MFSFTFIFFKFLQCINASVFILIIPCGIVTVSKSLQFENAQFPISVTVYPSILSGTITDVSVPL